jgi:hypothetical protein
MFLGELRTRNYDWQVIANSPNEALHLLEQAWESHAVGIPNPWKWSDLEDSVTITPMNLGSVISSCMHCENLAHNLEAGE